ncbi:Kynureninase (L-kynurenine hydrolase) [Pleosporales sp. CAS-2024a]
MPNKPPANPFSVIADAELCSAAFADKQDEQDGLATLNKEFYIPTKGDLRNSNYGFQQILNRTHGKHEAQGNDSDKSIYFCGNSLGLQPVRTKDYVNRYLDTWASKGVFGHFTDYEGGLPPWLHIDDAVKEQTSTIVGALKSEVVIMETLTANLHLLMSSFYRPNKDRWKIIIEGKAFPSDHYAALSQIALHNLDSSALITIEPPSSSAPYLSNEHILSVISQHAATTALVLLPGIQFYSGQFFDIELITRHCHAHGITVGWDLAHAVGNVPLALHDWNVDFAAWCNYKYMNAGPGVIGGAFVHERHGKVERNTDNTTTYRPRLAGWWGSDKSTRFAMDNSFAPIPGASGFQLSNPSALDMTSLMASLDVFALTSMPALRARSIRMTAYLEARLLRYQGGEEPPYTIITPANPAERGAQLSVLLRPGLLENVLAYLEEEGVVVDERKPDVLRIAPAPLYNSFRDVHDFVGIFHEACRKAVEKTPQSPKPAKGVPGAIAAT